MSWRRRRQLGASRLDDEAAGHQAAGVLEDDAPLLYPEPYPVATQRRESTAIRVREDGLRRREQEDAMETWQATRRTEEILARWRAAGFLEPVEITEPVERHHEEREEETLRPPEAEVERILRTRRQAWLLDLASVMVVLLVAWVLASCLPPAAAANVLTEEEKIFTAYDCSLPSNVTSVSLAGTPEECSERHLLQHQEKKKYNVLQKTNRVKIVMTHTRARYSRIVFFCGAATHSSIASREWLFNMPYPLTLLDHRKIWRDRQFARPHWQPSIFKDLVHGGKKGVGPGVTEGRRNQAIRLGRGGRHQA